METRFRDKILSLLCPGSDPHRSVELRLCCVPETHLPTAVVSCTHSSFRGLWVVLYFPSVIPLKSFAARPQQLVKAFPGIQDAGNSVPACHGEQRNLPEGEQANNLILASEINLIVSLLWPPQTAFG